MSSISIREFFLNENYIEPFGIFSLGHWFSIISVLIGIIIIYKNREKLRNIDKKTKEIVEKVMVVVLFINMKLLYIPLLLYGQWTWKAHLPLHMCFIAGYLFMYSVWFKKRKVYKVVYFLAFIGPIPAILLPDLKGYYDAFIFYHFIISHHLLILFNMLYLYMENIEIKIKNVMNALAVSITIFFIMYIFNQIFGTNYIFSNAIPEHVLNLMPFLRSFDNPVLILVITGVIVLWVAYIPIYIENRSKRLKKTN